MLTNTTYTMRQEVPQLFSTVMYTYLEEGVSHGSSSLSVSLSASPFHVPYIMHARYGNSRVMNYTHNHTFPITSTYPNNVQSLKLYPLPSCDLNVITCSFVHSIILCHVHACTFSQFTVVSNITKSTKCSIIIV